MPTTSTSPNTDAEQWPWWRVHRRTSGGHRTITDTNGTRARTPSYAKKIFPIHGRSVTWTKVQEPRPKTRHHTWTKVRASPKLPIHRDPHEDRDAPHAGCRLLHTAQPCRGRGWSPVRCPVSTMTSYWRAQLSRYAGNFPQPRIHA